MLHAALDCRHVALDNNNSPADTTGDGDLTFIWSTKKMHLLLTPPFMTMIGARSLEPDLKKVFVYFTDGGGPQVNPNTPSPPPSALPKMCCPFIFTCNPGTGLRARGE